MESWRRGSAPGWSCLAGIGAFLLADQPVSVPEGTLETTSTGKPQRFPEGGKENQESHALLVQLLRKPSEGGHPPTTTSSRTSAGRQTSSNLKFGTHCPISSLLSPSVLFFGPNSSSDVALFQEKLLQHLDHLDCSFLALQSPFFKGGHQRRTQHHRIRKLRGL